MMSGTSSPQPRSVPWWVVVAVFVVLPVTLSFVISRQAAAQLIRRKAIASSHGWATENKNEGRRVWILRGFHRDVEFEAVQLLREGGGGAWRLRMGLGFEVPSWVLLTRPGAPFRAEDFGTISALVTRSALPPSLPSPVAGLAVRAEVAAAERVLSPALFSVVTAAALPGDWAVSLVDDAVVLDGVGDLPEGEALVPFLELSASLVRLLSRDAG